jgi:hypothetical protein
MKYLSLLLLLLLATSALAAVPPEGTWEWVSTEESPGVFTTPVDLGYTVQRQFLADGTYNEFRDETLHRTGVFWVEDVEWQGMVIPALRIHCAPEALETSAYSFNSQEMELLWGANAGGWPSYPLELLARRDPVAEEKSSWGRIKSLYR